MMNVAVLSNNHNFPYIEKQFDNIVAKEVSIHLDATRFLKSIKNIRVDLVVLDTTDLPREDERPFISALTEFIISNDKTRIIVLDLKRKEGSLLLHEFVTLAIHDIITIDDPESIAYNLRLVLDEPKSIGHSLRYKVDTQPMGESKQTLVEKVVTKNLFVKKIVIALSGTHFRCGTTHVALSLSYFLKVKGYSVAFIALQGQKHIQTFLKSYEETSSKEGFYSLNGIDYYLNHSDFDIKIPYKKDYDFVVLDCGIYDRQSQSFDEYIRATIRGVVTTAREWEIEYLAQLLDEDDTSAELLINYTDDTLFNYIVDQLKPDSSGVKAYQVPFEANITKGDKMYPLFEQWLSQYLSNDDGSIKTSRKGLLKKIFK